MDRELPPIVERFRGAIYWGRTSTQQARFDEMHDDQPPEDYWREPEELDAEQAAG